MKKNRAIIIDGNAVIYRVFYAAYRDKQEDPDLKAFLFILGNKLKSCLKKNEYGYAVFVFDSTRDTFRKQKFSDYKSNRESMPKVLLNGMEEIKNLVKSMGFNIVMAPKPFEGDDAVCTLAKIFENNKIKTDVITTDKDLLQLVSYFTSVIFTFSKKAQEYNFENFESLNSGLLPHQIPIVKAIEGDSSDNYPGVEGIGKKRALELVLKYGNLEKIYADINNLSEKQKNSLIKHKESAYLFYELAQTRSNLELSNNLEEYKFRNNESDSGIR